MTPFDIILHFLELTAIRLRANIEFLASTVREILDIRAVLKFPNWVT